MPAKVAIHTVPLDPARRGGGETYIRNLVRGLSHQADLGPECYSLTTGRDGWEEDLPRGVETVRAPIDPAQRKKRLLWEELHAPRWLKGLGVDLVHFPYGSCPRRYRQPHVITIHDTQRFFTPKEIPRVERAYKMFVEGSIRRNKPRVICVSRTDAAAFCKFVGYPEDRVTTVYHGVDHDVFHPPLQPVTQHDRVAWVGRPYPRKNLDLVLRALPVLAEMGFPQTQLQAVGPSESEAAALRQRSRELGVADRLLIHPPVPSEQLPGVLWQAKVFCYPSLYESFGLPVLEAMACGLPCVLSDRPCFRELHGDIPEYCDPHDPRKLAEALATLLGDEALRQRKSAAGIAHAKTFTWERCVRETVGVYRACLAERGA